MFTHLFERANNGQVLNDKQAFFFEGVSIIRLILLFDWFKIASLLSCFVIPKMSTSVLSIKLDIASCRPITCFVT